MKTKDKPATAEYAYTVAHAAALRSLDFIRELLCDLPAPGNDEHPINWNHVGTVCEALTRLESAREFLAGTER
jgi:hypothetical protein